MNSRRFFPLLLLFLISIPLQAQRIHVAIEDSIYQRIGPDFYGIQYHSNTLTSADALAKLEALQLRDVRIWARVAEFHPQPDVWSWQELDQKVDEIVAAGYRPIVCLYQSENWYTGSAADPWWQDSLAVIEWQKAAFALASRYRDRVRDFIIFDEPNMLHADRDFYMPFAQAAQLYLQAAKEIRRADQGLRVGGPSAFAGWENGHWANYVLREPQGAEYLDFISSNLFISWDAEDPDSLLLDRTIWYEEAARKMRLMFEGQAEPELLLDAYNLSALWMKDGELWTDSRNTSIVGGVYHALAVLHAAKGGFQRILHWETLGGFGVLQWFPDYRELAPYWSWRFLIESAGLSGGAEILGCETTQNARENLAHHSGMNVLSYVLQPFAIRRADGGKSVILINKSRTDTARAVVQKPFDAERYALYVYDAHRQQQSLEPLFESAVGDSVYVEVPPYAVSVVRFSTSQTVEVDQERNGPASTLNIQLSVWPNPVRHAASIAVFLPEPMQTELSVFDVLGRKLTTLQSGTLTAGWHKLKWSPKIAGTGIYNLRLISPAGRHTARLLWLPDE